MEGPKAIFVTLSLALTAWCAIVFVWRLFKQIVTPYQDYELMIQIDDTPIRRFNDKAMYVAFPCFIIACAIMGADRPR